VRIRLLFALALGASSLGTRICYGYIGSTQAAYCEEPQR
jgi:hypothetical protein